MLLEAPREGDSGQTERRYGRQNFHMDDGRMSGPVTCDPLLTHQGNLEVGKQIQIQIGPGQGPGVS